MVSGQEVKGVHHGGHGGSQGKPATYKCRSALTHFTGEMAQRRVKDISFRRLHAPDGYFVTTGPASRLYRYDGWDPGSVCVGYLPWRPF